MMDVYLGLGSNLGAPLQQLQACLTLLRQAPAIELVAVSPWYGSTAIGPGQQPDYVNGVAHIRTSLAPEELLQRLQHIELQQGRERGPERWLPRTLDLDILLYGNAVIDQPRLQVPHPRMRERNFVLIPLFDLAPELILPDGTALRTLVQQCSHDGLWRLDSNGQ